MADGFRMSARGRPRNLTIALLLGWLGVGLWGAYLYGHRYWLYRGFPPPVTPAGIARGTTHLVPLYSSALHEDRSYLVYLPAGYRAGAARGRRFPVLYLLHAPPGRPDGYFLAGAIGVRANVLIAHHRMPPTIMVVPYGKTHAFHSDTEWANAGAGHYMNYVLDVVRDVDHRFATLPDRQHRAIAGLSEGGYGALNVALHHLELFSAVESWSGYFNQTPTGPFAGAALATVRANSPAAYVPRLAPRIRHLGFRAWLYQGKTDFTAPWRIRRFGFELHRAGADVHVGFFPGGHDWELWRAQVPRMLLAAGSWFSHAPRTDRGHFVQLGHRLPHAVLHRILFNPRRHCLIRHPPPGFKLPSYCAAYRARLRAGRGSTTRSAGLATGPPVDLLSASQLRALARVRAKYPRASLLWRADRAGWTLELRRPAHGGATRTVQVIRFGRDGRYEFAGHHHARRGGGSAG